MITEKKACPNGCGEMEVRQVEKSIVFKGINITYSAEIYVCPNCNIEVGSVKQAANMQQNIVDIYREKTGLMTGNEIRNLRKQNSLTQAMLADKMKVGIASIKRWETGQIQSKSMDNALRSVFRGEKAGQEISGNREFSISRIRLVLDKFASTLNRKFLKQGDKMLFEGKYLWYADMVAHRELGQSMTGANYAALPMGPQLNNYDALAALIRKENGDGTDQLSDEEEMIISRISKTFPTNSDIYEASHQEPIWKEAVIGSLILYSDSDNLSQI